MAAFYSHNCLPTKNCQGWSGTPTLSELLIPLMIVVLFDNVLDSRVTKLRVGTNSGRAWINLSLTVPSQPHLWGGAGALLSLKCWSCSKSLSLSDWPFRGKEQQRSFGFTSKTVSEMLRRVLYITSVVPTVKYGVKHLKWCTQQTLLNHS